MSDPYLVEWNPRAYLQQYYSTPYIPDDSRALLAFLMEQLPIRPGGYDRAIEFGCGPTLYTALALCPHVRQLHLADYLPSNLEELRLWLADEPEAHNWRVYVRAILEQEQGRPPTNKEMAARETELRKKIAGLHHADIRQAEPLGTPQVFDLVTSFFCIEAVSTNRSDWASLLENLSCLVAADGMMVLAALRRCNGYEVLGRIFPTARVDETDFQRVLPAYGFDPSSLVIRSVPITEWAAEGFDSICLVSAVKHG
jgi:nicotinamide N-methyltransferase